MNEWFEDAGRFLRHATQEYSAALSGMQLFDCVALTAFGVERILKGILWEVNPVFVLKEAAFPHSVQSIYADRILEPRTRQKSALANKPNKEVLSYRVALGWAATVSSVTRDHTALLYRLADQRDTVAHRLLSELSEEDLKRLLFGHVPDLLRAYARELTISLSHFVGGHEVRLASLAIDFKSDVPEQVQARLYAHLKKFEGLKGVEGYCAAAEAKTMAVDAGNLDWESMQCPACRNTALAEVDIEVDYDHKLAEFEIAGKNVIQVRCHFCKLRVSDFAELDWLRTEHFLDEVLNRGFKVRLTGPVVDARLEED